jgi:HAD superfamily hydrolase (TIGR01509 family)
VIEALLLDFDGLLYDTETAAYGAWADVFARYGQELPMDVWVRDVMGRPPGSSGFDPAAYLAQATGLEIDRPAVLAEREFHKRDRLPRHLMAGAEALLRDAGARGLLTAIVTSNHHDHVREHLARAGSSHRFDALVSADGDLSRGKPNPALYLEALAALGLAPGKAVAFEDSPNGVAAAKAAGLTCVAVPNAITRGAPGLDAADRQLNSLADVDLDALTS